MKEKVLKPDLAIDPMDQRGLRDQLVDQLRDQIETGRIPAGAKLPTLKQFASMYQVGDNTARAIMKQLDCEGLIVRRRKLGTYVRYVSSSTDLSAGTPALTVLFRMARDRADYKSDLSPWNMDFIRIFENLACKQGYRVSLAAVTSEVKGETPADQEKVDNASGYLVLLGQKESQVDFVKNLMKVNRPVVVCNYYNDGFSGMRINEDWTWGTREILQHLQSLGHRRIAFCSISTELRGDSVWVSQREESFVSQASLLGLPADRDDIFSVNQDIDTDLNSRGEYKSGLMVGRKLFGGKDKYTAVVAANLKVANGLTDAAREKNIVIPRDLSLITYDDSDIALINGMTTVVRDKLRDAGDAVRLLSENIDNRSLSQSVTIVNKPLLIVRGSTGLARTK